MATLFHSAAGNVPMAGTFYLGHPGYEPVRLQRCGPCRFHMLLRCADTFLLRLQKFFPSGKGYGKEVTIGQYVTDVLLSQNYFETIFTRIPKKVTDDIVAELQLQGLPHVAIGNGGQGGPDRRGTDDGRARPASVKVLF